MKKDTCSSSTAVAAQRRAVVVVQEAVAAPHLLESKVRDKPHGDTLPYTTTQHHPNPSRNPHDRPTNTGQEHGYARGSVLVGGGSADENTDRAHTFSGL